MRGVIDVIRGQRATGGVAPAIRQLRLQDAGGAGAQKYADALRPVLFDRRLHRAGESVLLQAQQREAIVAAVECCQGLRQAYGIDAGHFAHPRRQINGVEATRRESAAAISQCLQHLVEAPTNANW